MSAGQILVTLGAVALLAWLVGGGLKAFGVDVPVITSTTRQIGVAIAGLMFLALGIYLEIRPTAVEPPSATMLPNSTSGAATNPTEIENVGRSVQEGEAAHPSTIEDGNCDAWSSYDGPDLRLNNTIEFNKKLNQSFQNKEGIASFNIDGSKWSTFSGFLKISKMRHCRLENGVLMNVFHLPTTISADPLWQLKIENFKLDMSTGDALQQLDNFIGNEKEKIELYNAQYATLTLFCINIHPRNYRDMEEVKILCADYSYDLYR